MKRIHYQLALVVAYLSAPSAGFATEVNVARPYWSGDIGVDFSYYRADYVNRTFAANTDLTRHFAQNETQIESALDNQTLSLPGTSGEINRFRYDANIKWKYFYEDTPWFSYISPRIRHNDYGNFRQVQALRLGGGRIFSFQNRIDVTLETGVGYRYATLPDHRNIQENLVIFSGKAIWNISSDISIKFKLNHEQSALEKYRTSSFELRNRLTDSSSLNIQVIEKRTFPYDITNPNGELTTTMGISYEI